MISSYQVLSRKNAQALLILEILFLSLFFIFLSRENVFFSSGWEVLTLREIDDYALFQSLIRIQDSLLAGKFESAFRFVDYAYGNGFWLLNAVALLPFRLLSDPQSIIIGGRTLTLLFTIGSLFLIGKITSLLSGSRMLGVVATFFAVLMPAITIWSLRFHVNSQYMFWGLLSYYLAVRRRAYLFAAAALGSSIGFKLTGILILPLVLGTYATDLWSLGKDRRQIINAVSKFLMITVIAFIATAEPYIFANPVVGFQEFKSTIKFFSSLGASAQKASPFQLWQEGISKFYLSTFAQLIFFSTLGWTVWKSRRSNAVFRPLFILLTFLGCLVFSTILMRKGPVYTQAYSIGVLCLLPVSLAFLSGLNVKKHTFAIAIMCLLGFEIWNSWDFRLSNMTHYSSVSESPIAIAKLKDLMQLRQMIFKPDHPIKIIRDCNTVFPLTSFDRNVTERLNFGNMRTHAGEDFDFIVLDQREANGFPQEVDKYEKSIRDKLRNEGVFSRARFKQVFSSPQMLVFKREDEDSSPR